MYWKGYSERSLIAYANGEEQQSVLQSDPELKPESEPVPATGFPSDVVTGSDPELKWQYESDSNTPSTDEYAQPADDSQPAQPAQSAEPVPSAKPNMNMKPQQQSEDSADDEIPGSPSASETPVSQESAESPISPEEKYGQAMQDTQASCEERMKEVEKGAETGIKQVDRNDPYAVKAWSDRWTKEITAAESSCDRSFEEVSDKAANESVSQRKIEDWKMTYDAKKIELREESKANLERLLRG